jgi:hypothetical protein
VTNDYYLHAKARSSAGEHFPDTEGVGGSIPPVPTKLSRSAVVITFTDERGGFFQ